MLTLCLALFVRVWRCHLNSEFIIIGHLRRHGHTENHWAFKSNVNCKTVSLFMLMDINLLRRAYYRDIIASSTSSLQHANNIFHSQVCVIANAPSVKSFYKTCLQAFYLRFFFEQKSFLNPGKFFRTPHKSSNIYFAFLQQKSLEQDFIIRKKQLVRASSVTCFVISQKKIIAIKVN